MKYHQFAMMSFLLVLLCGGNVLRAEESASAPVKVENPWARATPAGSKTGVVYMTLVNAGAVGDRLLGATTPVADQVQFHMNTAENGMMRMRELTAIDIGPGAKVMLKPSGTHAMLLGLKQPLKEGQTFPLTLNFEKAGKIEVIVSIAKIGAMEHQDMSNMSH